MKIIPAIDLKDGKCVRLLKGKEDSFEVFNNDPVKQAVFFEKEGCKRIHIVDLDAAFDNKNTNKSIILEIRKTISIDIELGGGIRTEEEILFWTENGINFLVVGSLAIQSPESFKKISKKYLERIYVSLDDYSGKIMINGWLKESNYKTEQVLNNYNNTNIKGFIFTDVSRDGTLEGINTNKIKDLLAISKKQIIVGGGLSSYNDLNNLLNIGKPLLEGVIVGKSFYTGNINIKKAQNIFKNA